MDQLLQNIIVLGIVSIAAVYLVRRFWKTIVQPEGNCGCGSRRGCAKMMQAMDDAARSKK